MQELATYLQQADIAEPLRIVTILTLLSLVPMLFIAVTCFTRFVVVFSLLRFALGLQQTPPNIVLITLSLFLTFYVMGGTLEQINTTAVKPYVEQSISLPEAIDNVEDSFKSFMIRQTREEDLAAIVTMGGHEMPASIEEVRFFDLVPAFLLSELRTAFKIGFIIFVPFLLIDLVTSSILMSLGMIMLPPITVSLPIKIMLFVLIDGWSLISQSLVSSVI
jgi:flagellar biosynthesis protein FliP